MQRMHPRFTPATLNWALVAIAVIFALELVGLAALLRAWLASW